ncbi:3-keto-5-aminohexanoate cleavage protein [Spirillospora sp. NPDC052269]
MPVTVREVAAEAARAVRAGARELHVHPKDGDGRDSLAPEVVGAFVSAVRAAVPSGVRVGVTTGAWAAPEVDDRLAVIGGWRVLPDYASVNWHEDGAEEVAAALLDLGVGVEAGVWSGTDGAQRFSGSGLVGRVLRVLAEVVDTDPATAADTADELLAQLPGGVSVLLHGEDGGAWPVLEHAGRLGLDTRIGLEDTLLLPDGTRADGNAALVGAALSVPGVS